MKVKVPYNFGNDIERDEDVPFVERFEDEEVEHELEEHELEEHELSENELGEHELGEHELGENLTVFDFDFEWCTNDELIEFMLDFFNTNNEEELYQFLSIYNNIIAEDDKVT
ncbi:hypothetical protein ALC57_08262 [Trachymyrmex cornetzi]|uniref:Uncharacterized protein n=1 Tax=Trachymyrmex cornetzi TaxID=471704 RepID=A0A151J7H7_9HYME|nr:hypothetical protein ALC57_08262 [Trachymyrmex cornetzi]